MIGIKSAMRLYLSLNNKRLTNDYSLREFMLHFRADERGHRANIDAADLGYGWIHYGLVRHQKPDRILAVGSGYGYIPALLAQACHDNGHGHVDFVDAGYGHGHRNGYSWVGFWKTIEGQMVFEDYGLGAWITLFLMTTKDFFKKHNDLLYDYIYIDGDHLYKGVKYDVDHALPQLRKGGFLALHDISITDPMPEGKYGVARVWKEIAQKNYLIFQHPISGLGIMQKS